MSTGITLVGVLEFLPRDVKTTPISMKMGDSASVGSQFAHGSCQAQEQERQACTELILSPWAMLPFYNLSPLKTQR